MDAQDETRRVMFELKIGSDITALCEESDQGSDVLLFRRNTGFLGRICLPETGQALVNRLELSMKLSSSPESGSSE